MQAQSVKTYENPCNLINDNFDPQSEISSIQSNTNYHHYYYPSCHPFENPSTTINPVTINIIDNNNSKIDPDSLLPCLQLSTIMTGSNKISIESLTANPSGHLKNSPTTISIGNNLINHNNNITTNNNNNNNNHHHNNNNNNNINSNMNHINNQTNINHNCINTINSSVNNSINSNLNNHSNYTTTNKLMMKLLPWCKLKRKQFVFRDSLSCDDISSVMFKRSSVQPISGLFNDKNHHHHQTTTTTPITSSSSSSSPSTSTMITSTSITPSTSSTLSSSSNSTTSSSSMTMARLFTGKRNSHNNKSNSNINSILSYTLTNRKRNCHNNSLTNGHSGSSISSYPMVSFVNKGEGLVTVDSTFDRILMSNENELYSLGSAINNHHSQHSHSHHHHHPSSTSSSISSSFNSFSNGSSSLSSSKSMGNLGANYGPSCSRINSSSTYSTSDCDLPSVYGSLSANELPPWFYGPICRDKAITILARQPIGSFLVRESISKAGCYALSLRVPKRFQVTGVAHYLILRSSQGTFKIKGFTKEFTSLHSLIVHHSIMQELLPCPLDLATIKIHQQLKNSQTIIINPNEAQTQLIEETTITSESTLSSSTSTSSGTSSTTINSTPSATVTMVPSSSSSSSSSSTITPTINTNYDYNDDLLVDIDSDPDYQRILTSFRKTMATCR